MISFIYLFYLKIFTKKKFKASLNGIRAVQRECAITSDICTLFETTCKQSGLSDCTCKTCNTDYCNDSTRVHDFKFKIITVGFVAVLFSMFYL